MGYKTGPSTSLEEKDFIFQFTQICGKISIITKYYTVKLITSHTKKILEFLISRETEISRLLLLYYAWKTRDFLRNLEFFFAVLY
jgi:hypothetical protein